MKSTGRALSHVASFRCGPYVYSPENRFAFRALTDAFQLLVETLREKLGGTYSPGVQGGCSREPRQGYTIQVQFGSSPENVALLSQAVFVLIDTLKTTGPSSADVEKMREQITRAREVEVKQKRLFAGQHQVEGPGRRGYQLARRV